jgi:hypothetical protein
MMTYAAIALILGAVAYLFASPLIQLAMESTQKQKPVVPVVDASTRLDALDKIEWLRGFLRHHKMTDSLHHINQAASAMFPCEPECDIAKDKT